MPDTSVEGFYPGLAPIESYGDGGFRFAGMSHRGSLLVLPDGIYAWAATDAAALVLTDFQILLAQREKIQFVLLGTGTTQVFAPPAIRQGFDAAGLGLDAMTTGAAARTFNVLLAEGRKVAAALIAVP
jgi:uncharacterized protein